MVISCSCDSKFLSAMDEQRFGLVNFFLSVADVVVSQSTLPGVSCSFKTASSPSVGSNGFPERLPRFMQTNLTQELSGVSLLKSNSVGVKSDVCVKEGCELFSHRHATPPQTVNRNNLLHVMHIFYLFQLGVKTDSMLSALSQVSACLC